MASLATISVIDGRPTLAAEAQRALIIAAGHEIGFDEANQSRCIAWGRRRGSQYVARVTWTIDDAKRAGLAGRNAWRTYPRQMLVARASAELAREMFPDVLRGLVATEEVIDYDGAAGTAAAPSPTAPSDDSPAPATRRRRRKAAEPAPAPVRDGDGEGAPSAGTSNPSAAVPAAQDLGTPGPENPTEPNPDEGPLPWSDEQRAAIFALFRDLGLGGDEKRDARLGYTSRVVQRPLESHAELTMGEASSLIDDLHRIVGLEPDERWRELLPERELRLVEEGDDLGGTWSDP